MSTNLLAVVLTVAAIVPGMALQPQPSMTRAAWKQPLAHAVQGAQAATAAGMVAAAILALPMDVKAAPSMTDAIVESSEATYPILKSLDQKQFEDFTGKLGGIIVDISPEKLTRALDLGIDVLNSADQGKIAALNSVAKDAFAGLDTGSCDLVPLPPSSLVDKFVEKQLPGIDPERLKTFDSNYGGLIRSLPKTSKSICLPAPEALDKLALAQADVGRSFSADSTRKFGKYTAPMLKSSVPVAKVVPLVKLGQGLTLKAEYKDRVRFEKAGKDVEKAAKKEATDAGLAF